MPRRSVLVKAKKKPIKLTKKEKDDSMDKVKLKIKKTSKLKTLVESIFAQEEYTFTVKENLKVMGHILMDLKKETLLKICMVG